MATRSHFPRTTTALLLVDVINPFDFDGGPAFARRALPYARRISRLAARARRAAVPVVYVNDNFGRWRSDLAELVAFCRRPGKPGAPIAACLTPQTDDFVILKPSLSGFFQTPLETMLRLGGVRRLVIAGFSADNCVLFTAADAHMRGFELVVPRDCVAGKTPADERDALERMRELLDARTPAAPALRLRA